MKNKLEAFVCGILFAVTLAIWFAPKPAAGASGEPASIQEAVSVGYKLDRQTGLFRAGIVGADSTTIDSTFLTACPDFVVNGRASIPVSARFGTAGANTVVRWVAVAKDPGTGTQFVTGISPPVTLTASSIVDASGKYMAPTYTFDSYGTSDGRLMVISVSAGNVAFAVGSY